MEGIKEVKASIQEVSSGKNRWPKASLELKFNLNSLVTADKESITNFMQAVFAVIGPNCEMMARFTGYWVETLPTKTLGERAEKLGLLYKE